jgi:hypothetical protein
VIARLYRALGATHDERVVAIVALVLVPAIPFLFALATANLPVAQ